MHVFSLFSTAWTQGRDQIYLGETTCIFRLHSIRLQSSPSLLAFILGQNSENSQGLCPCRLLRDLTRCCLSPPSPALDLNLLPHLGIAHRQSRLLTASGASRSSHRHKKYASLLLARCGARSQQPAQGIKLAGGVRAGIQLVEVWWWGTGMPCRVNVEEMHKNCLTTIYLSMLHFFFSFSFFLQINEELKVF